MKGETVTNEFTKLQIFKNQLQNSQNIQIQQHNSSYKNNLKHR
jgi:hypothetical protein